MSGAGNADPDVYPVVSVDPRRATGPEQMGSKPKFWYRPSDDDPPHPFRYPQAGTGQHWAEKIAAEIAGCLGLLHARVELAVVRGKRGSSTVSFAHGGRTLVHGNEVLSRTMPCDRDKRFGQSKHTLTNIFLSLEAVFTTEAGTSRAKRGFAGYLVLDALIGNTDRHHENWGLLVERTETGLQGSLAPTFDHASALGRELSDHKRRTRLPNGTVGDYSEKGRGGIFWTASGRYGPSPLDLARRAATEHPGMLREPLERVRDRHSAFERIVRRVPDDWMSATAQDFAVALLDYNAAQLERCLR